MQALIVDVLLAFTQGVNEEVCKCPFAMLRIMMMYNYLSTFCANVSR